MMEALDNKRLGNIKVWIVKEVSLMGEGESFGELGLMT